MPEQRLDNGNWPHPARLPLGGGWSGHCTAPGHEGELPQQHILEAFCNLGYADSCMWVPADRSWDAVRFAVSAPQDPQQQNPSGSRTSAASPAARLIQIRYVGERNHLPVEHGSLQFDLDAANWTERHTDSRLQKMAECFLESYMKKKDREKKD